MTTLVDKPKILLISDPREDVGRCWAAWPIPTKR